MRRFPRVPAAFALPVAALLLAASAVRVPAGEIVLTPPVAQVVVYHDSLCTHAPCGGREQDGGAEMGVERRDGCGRQSHMLLAFDLTDLRSDQEITSAVVRLYAVEQTEYNSATFCVARLTEAFVPGETDWCRRAEGKPWTTPGGTYAVAGMAARVVPSKVAEDLPPVSTKYAYRQWLEFDVTGIVRDWVEKKAPNCGLVVFQRSLGMHGRNQAVAFATEKRGAGAEAPQLAITFGGEAPLADGKPEPK